MKLFNSNFFLLYKNGRKKPLTHEITDDVAIKIKKIIGGNYQQAALGTIDDKDTHGYKSNSNEL